MTKKPPQGGSLGDEATFDLKPNKAKMPKSTGAGELRALNALVADLARPDINPQTPNPVSALPGDALVPVPAQKRVAAPMLNPPPRAHAIAPSPRVEVPKLPPQLNLFFTGRMKVGKDHCAKAAGAQVFSLAEPLYALLKFYFGTDNKDAYGARKFLQQCGQWGRNDISAHYPITAERAAFCSSIRAAAARVLPETLCVDWASYGRDKDIWVKALLRRVEAFRKANGDGRRIAVTNVRFENEFKAFKEAGWSHWHVMCSPAIREVRLLQAGLDPRAPEQSDASEAVAAAFDANMAQKTGINPRGGMLKCIWSDESGPPPSHRLFTVAVWASALEESNES